MSPQTLGARYLAACAGLGVEPWLPGMRDDTGTDIVLRVHPVRLLTTNRNGWSRLSPRSKAVPDLSDAATMGAALGTYDIVRGRSAPDPVYLAATVYELTARETQTALVEALERLAAERASGGAP
jgi:hypothetical protein